MKYEGGPVMVTKMIAKADCLAEKAKSCVAKLHKEAKNNRGAEMMEIALVVGVIVGIYSAFKLLQNSVTQALDRARTAVEGTAGRKG